MTYRCDRCSRQLDEAVAAALAKRCPCGGVLGEAGLGEIDADRLPYPLALTLGKLRVALADTASDAGPLAALFALKDCFEAGVKFLGSVLVAEYLAGPGRSAERDAALIEKMVRPSLGHWVKEICRRAAGWTGGRAAALLLTTGRGAPAETPLLKRCGEFVTFRNDGLGHGAGRAAARYRADLGDWLPVAGDLLRGIAGLSRPLLLVTSEDLAQVWVGAEPSAAVVPGAFRRDDVGRFVLGPPPGGGVLSLFPFLSYLPDPDKRNRLHFYDSLYRYTAARKEATVLEYDGGERHPRPEPMTGLEEVFTADLLAKAFHAHRGRMAVIEGRVANFGEIIEAHADIVGRGFAVERVRRLLRDHDRGLLVIEGEPGKGKTALLSHLIENVFGGHAPRPVHFFYRRTAGITDPDVCVKSLYHALLEAHGLTEAESSRGQRSPEEVFNKLVNLLADEIAPRLSPGRPQLIFLDALDEADADAFRRIPENLPAGVYVVATTRPVRRRTTLARRAHLHWFDLDAPDLVPANLADGREYVGRELLHADLSSDTRDELARVGGGNFLVLKLLCRHARTGMPADEVRPFLRRLAAGDGKDHLGFIYAEFWERILAQCPPQFAQALLDVAGVLVLAHAPLPKDVICSVLGLNGTGWDFASRYLMEYLTAIRHEEGDAEETFYRVYHESFADFLRAKLTDRDRRELRGKLADYCRGWADLPDGFGRTYAVRFGPRHQIDAGDSGAAADVLLDLEYLEERAADGGVYELPGVMRECAGAVAADDHRGRFLRLLEEAMRRDVRFLAAHPGSLFQSLWNLAWWYDCPDAARYYRATGAGEPPWAFPGPKLYELLERWRAEKVKRSPGFYWLRSLAPVAPPLGSPAQFALHGFARPVSAVAYSPDGRRLVAASSEFATHVPDQVRDWEKRYEILTWDAQTGKPIGRFLPDYPVELAPGYPGGEYDRADLERLWQEFHEGGVNALAWSPDGRSIASACRDGRVRVWDAESRGQVEMYGIPLRPALAVAFSPCGQFLAVGSEVRNGGHGATVWDRKSGRLSHSFAPELEGWMRYVETERDKLWTFRFDPTPGEFHPETHVRCVAFSPDGKTLAFGGEHYVLWLASLESGVVTHLRGHAYVVSGVSISQDGRRAVTASWDRSVRVWDLDAGREAIAPILHPSDHIRVAFAPDGRTFATTWNPQGRPEVRVWDAASGTLLRSFTGHEHTAKSICYGDQGRVLACGTSSGAIQTWDARGGAAAVERSEEHTRPIYALVVRNESSEVVTGSSDGTIRVWDVTTERVRLFADMRTGYEVGLLCISPDASLLAAVSYRTVAVWDFATGARRWQSAGPYRHQITSIRFSADGTRIITDDERDPSGFAADVGVGFCSWSAETGAYTEYGCDNRCGEPDHVPIETDDVPGEAPPVRRFWLTHGQRTAFAAVMTSLQGSSRPVAWLPQLVRGAHSLGDGRSWAVRSEQRYPLLFRLEGGDDQRRLLK